MNGRLRQAGEAPRDLGLADARRADHENVLGQNLLAQTAVELLAPPAIAQRDRHGALGIGLPDDMAIELGDDLARRKRRHVRFFHHVRLVQDIRFYGNG
jgi:hypothetical protein